jgi:hypothetical protein
LLWWRWRLTVVVIVVKRMTIVASEDEVGGHGVSHSDGSGGQK